MRIKITEQEKRHILKLHMFEQGSADINADRRSKEQLDKAAEEKKVEEEKQDRLKKFPCIPFQPADGDVFGYYPAAQKWFIRSYNPNSVQVFWLDKQFQQFAGGKGKPLGGLTMTGTWKCNASNTDVEISATPISQTGSSSNNMTDWMKYLKDDVFTKTTNETVGEYQGKPALKMSLGNGETAYYTEKNYYIVNASGGLLRQGWWSKDAQGKFSTGVGVNPNEPPPTVAAVPLTDVASGKGTLKLGSYGESVGNLQQLLMNKGYLKISNPTNYFGTLTAAAVKAAQAALGLEKQDGIVGSETYSKLYYQPNAQEVANIQPKGIQTTTATQTPVAPQQVVVPPR